MSWLLFTVVVAVAGASDFPFLPPLLKFRNGTSVVTPQQWEERKQEVGDLLQEYILGTAPTEAPPLESARLLNRTVYSRRGNATSTFVELTFTVDDQQISFPLEILAPPIGDSVDSAPLPLFMTQWNHRGWAMIGVSHGYVSVLYPAADCLDVAPQFQKAYPKHTMMLIMARAFVASRALDFLLGSSFAKVTGLPPVNENQVCISGHSRNGKQSLLAAAFDPRIAAVVGSSPGAPIASPYHLSSHNYYGEGPDAGQAGHWWLNSTLQYAAHPEQLPMDGHGVLAMIAPRFAMVANAWTDHEGDVTLADEMAVQAASEVYSLLNAPGAVRVVHRPGDHHGFLDANTYFDWFDVNFGLWRAPQFLLSWMNVQPCARVHGGRGDRGEHKYTFPPQVYVTPAGFDWELWNKLFPSPAAPPTSAPLQARINWLLQTEPGQEGDFTIESVGSSDTEDGVFGTRFSYRSVMQGVAYETDAAVSRLPVQFGDYVTANVYWPSSASSSESLPVVLWLHPYSYSTGYAATYQPSVITALVEKGVMVMAFDQVGFGTRVTQGGSSFYSRYGGQASLLGHMVRDARAAVDFLECRALANRSNATKCGAARFAYQFDLDKIPGPDLTKLVVAGYSLGGTVALHTAAADTRVSAVASFAGFTPFRSDSNDKPTGGLRRLYDLHALVPRLGLYRDAPQQVPYDYEELLSSLVAPRPTLLYTPQQDRDATYQDVSQCVAQAAKSWPSSSFSSSSFSSSSPPSSPSSALSSSSSLTHIAPPTYSKMDKDEITALVQWVKTV